MTKSKELFIRTQLGVNMIFVRREQAYNNYNKYYECDKTDDNNSNDDKNEINEFEMIGA